MKQILQSLKTGEIELADIPCPLPRHGHLLIQTENSLISAGTERMLVEFGRANLLNKARQQPEKVKMVLEKIGTDGLLPTIETVRNKLDQPLALGYSNAGVVLAVGEGVEGFSVGDRVVSNGSHAEVVSVPKNLCAKIPQGLESEQAAFTVVGAIALQGIRLASPTFGETFAVFGLGLIGLITVQLLKAQGCRVLGLDFDPARLELAKGFGAEVINLKNGEGAVEGGMAFSNGEGVDGVILTVSTDSQDPVKHAAQMCRKRGRIILVGVTGLQLNRADFFEKEITFQVSCSYGPGRYDFNYENRGNDYPLGFVRWTEQRNFQAVLSAMSEGQLNIAPLISHRIPIEDAGQAYDMISEGTPSLGMLLSYPLGYKKDLRATQVPLKSATKKLGAKVTLGFIGSGNYASGVLIPAFKKTSAQLRTIASQGGTSGVHAGRKHGFSQTTTDVSTLFSDQDLNTVVITTRHDNHAQLVIQALQAGKHVFVEKPLALHLKDIDAIEKAYQTMQAKDPSPVLMVGFNRRFAPHVKKIKTLLLASPGPKSLVMTVNAGHIPADHWTQDPEIGGGRIIGEGCHFIDLLRHLAGAPITELHSQTLGAPDSSGLTADKATISLKFSDGSIGSIHYLANGHRSFPKERLEVFSAGRVLQLDNFRILKGFGWPGFGKMKLMRQDKGNKACAQAFVQALESGEPAPIPFEELLEVSRFSIMAGSPDNPKEHP